MTRAVPLATLEVMSVLLSAHQITDPRPAANTWQRLLVKAPAMDPLPLIASSPPPSIAPEPAVPTEVQAFADSLVRAIIEIIQGRRQAHQLTRWLSDDAYAQVSLRSRRRWGPEQLSVCSTHLQRTGHETIEVAARVRAGHRSSAIALRLAPHAQRWICVEIDFGPIPPGHPLRP